MPSIQEEVRNCLGQDTYLRAVDSSEFDQRVAQLANSFPRGQLLVSFLEQGKSQELFIHYQLVFGICSHALLNRENEALLSNTLRALGLIQELGLFSTVDEFHQIVTLFSADTR